MESPLQQCEIDEQARSYREQLVQTLQTKGAIQSSQLRDAFLDVPRHYFVRDSFYLRTDPSPKTTQWTLLRRAQVSPATWLQYVYENEALVTHLDDRGIQPTSSSSLPSLMAWMLEVLSIQPGQRVLEIGTGTGYNAGLLAYLTGNPTCVTTIEFNSDLAESAQSICPTRFG